MQPQYGNQMYYQSGQSMQPPPGSIAQNKLPQQQPQQPQQYNMMQNHLQQQNFTQQNQQHFQQNPQQNFSQQNFQQQNQPSFQQNNNNNNNNSQQNFHTNSNPNNLPLQSTQYPASLNPTHSTSIITPPQATLSITSPTPASQFHPPPLPSFMIPTPTGQTVSSTQTTTTGQNLPQSTNKQTNITTASVAFPQNPQHSQQNPNVAQPPGAGGGINQQNRQGGQQQQQQQQQHGHNMSGYYNPGQPSAAQHLTGQSIQNQPQLHNPPQSNHPSQLQYQPTTIQLPQTHFIVHPPNTPAQSAAITQLIQTSRQRYSNLPLICPVGSTPLNLLSSGAQNKITIRQVYATNFFSEMAILRELLPVYNYVAMDTEFPGVVARPMTNYRNANEYQYALIKANADKLKLIQLGLFLCDEQGNCLPDYCCWQFNFQFDTNTDQYAQDSLDLLIKSGIDFDKLSKYGIPFKLFGSSLLTSGLLLNKKIHWLSFHSTYDFAYLARIFTNAPLPLLHSTFTQLLKLYCPLLYDIKYLMRCCDNLTGGLEKIGQLLKVHRTGQMHQAGSDSMLTAAVFFKIRHIYFDGVINEDKFAGIIYGLSSLPTQFSTPNYNNTTITANVGGGGGGSGNSNSNVGGTSLLSPTQQQHHHQHHHHHHGTTAVSATVTSAASITK
jgi:CCR4-NOT transcription complex subunit 7/8